MHTLAADAARAGIPCTNHFLLRWAERFPDEGLDGLLRAFERSETMPIVRLLSWLEMTGKRSRVGQENAYWWDAVTEALFVASPLPTTRPGRGGREWVLVTVFQFRQPKRKVR